MCIFLVWEYFKSLRFGGEDSFFLDFLKTLAQMQTILTNSIAELHVVLFVKSVHVGIPVREYSYRRGHLKAVLDSPVVWSYE